MQIYTLHDLTRNLEDQDMRSYTEEEEWEEDKEEDDEEEW
jgi:HD superfamily phosphohydrolase YqeK